MMEAMSETSHVMLTEITSRALAEVKCEKVGAREAQIIEQEIRKYAPPRKWRVAIDLSQVTMLASMGLGMLVSMHKSCQQEGGKLVVCGLSDELIQLLKLTHLERVLRIVPNKDEALKALA